MADTTPAAFDPACRNPNFNVQDYISGAAILKGQVVGFNTTGVDWTVQPIVQATTAQPVGVALASVTAAEATAGKHVAVACMGSLVKVCEGKGTGLDAGDFVNDCSVAGCVATGAVTSAMWQVGVMQTDAAANGTGYCLINPVYIGKGA